MLWCAQPSTLAGKLLPFAHNPSVISSCPARKQLPNEPVKQWQPLWRTPKVSETSVGWVRRARGIPPANPWWYRMGGMVSG